ncbi:MAG: biotin synthase BioB [Planctomycetes bacterium RIFCSPHIGHO2_02_FULL_40_12]|nr:MAG: biotin synthase BioB [Planctomycetes bacterium RIFCSPHIGHO2_02_FULL_40_12]OHC04231.1 MAG: biotin synthase BioB [Planctomycetes bacterium RIFCSPLOWO2_12_FULL_40_19]
MNTKIEKIANRVLQGKGISCDEAHFLMGISGNEIYDLLYWANRIRYNSFKNVISLCSIISARQGSCPEDCRFCSQSSRYQTDISNFPLVEKEQIAGAVERGKKYKSNCVGVVTSGYSLDGSDDFDRICEDAYELSKKDGPPIHTSIGTITSKMAKKLVSSGVEMINHNLETSEAYYPNICTTHTYKDRVETIKVAKEAGLKICSGGIFGVGESAEDRLDLAFRLKELDVDAIPLNFLSPVKGTPSSLESPLEPMEILKIIAVFRHIFPDKELKVAGGREENLRDVQSWMFYAGANSTMIGDYLTTRGKAPVDDLQMIKDLGLIYEGRDGQNP